jgi:deazaflavin-dependent oxidoreductase (nitroreductase family)
LAARGLGLRRVAALDVVGRRTGGIISLPVVVADYRGERYLVSMLGENTNWVRNVRAAGGRAVLSHGRREAIRLEDVGLAERGPILRQYLECAPGARSHVAVDRHAPQKAFDKVAGRYPVFRLGDH